jgi:23S rRNA (uracil1939-C5)-methyltransferase
MPGLRQIFQSVRAAAREMGLGGIVYGVEARSLAGDSESDVSSLVLKTVQTTSFNESVAIAKALLDLCPTVKSISGILDGRYDEPVHLAGQQHIVVSFLDERLSLSPTTFFQVNLPLAEEIARYTFAQIGDLSGRQVLDVYSGAGTFTVPIARRAESVIGIEVDPLAIADTRDTIARVGLDNVTLLEGDAGSSLKSLLPGAADYAIVDPPRTGCSPEVLRQLSRIKTPKLIYVSCDPATLARDLRSLLDHGYQLETVQPFDMFPQTAHIETVSTLKLPKKFRARR